MTHHTFIRTCRENSFFFRISQKRDMETETSIAATIHEINVYYIALLITN